MLDEEELENHIERLLRERRKFINERDYDQWLTLTHTVLIATAVLWELPSRRDRVQPKDLCLRIEPGEASLVLRALEERKVSALSSNAYGMPVDSRNEGEDR